MSVLSHRGPDDRGAAEGVGWALGHRRLSIVDLSERARQPFSDEKGRCHLVCNGEIYNHATLRRDLASQGHVFRSDSDSEILVHLLESGCTRVSDLNGMFAFAFLDEAARKLILCRDRLGIKPLYYYQWHGGIAFASESKAFRVLPQWRARLNEEVLGEHLRYRFVAGEQTLFREVKAVPPAGLISVDLDSLDIRQETYWSVERRDDGHAADVNVRLRHLLEQSVNDRLMSDVPLGTQLSGGLDSSLVTALAVAAGHSNFHTFSICFDEGDSEEKQALRVASKLGTRHHPIRYSERDFLQDLVWAGYYNDDPINHANSLPMLKLCREAKKEVTVLLTGEGADELFGGYSWHRRMAKLETLWPLLRWGGLRGSASYCDSSTRAGRLLQFAGMPRELAAVKASQWVSSAALKEIGYSDGWKEERRRANLGAVDTSHLFAAVLDVDRQAYLTSVLQRQDRMSMAAAIESRVPFLDHRVVEFSMGLERAAMLQKSEGKAVVRAVAADLLPSTTIAQPKIGFRVPLTRWFSKDKGLGALLRWVHDDRAGDRGIWRPDWAARVVERHKAGKEDHTDLLWVLLTFELWARLYVDTVPVDELSAEAQGIVGANAE